MLEQKRKRMNYLRRNTLSFEELNELKNEECVNVSSNCFYNLIALAQLRKIKDTECFIIFNRYLNVEKMQNHLNNPVVTYFIMSVKDIKYLINTIDAVPSFKLSFLKSNITTSELDEIHNNIKRQYEEKLQKDYTNSNSYSLVHNAL